MGKSTVGEQSAARLVGEYVRVASDFSDRLISGLFTEAFEEGTGGGYVYVFSEQRYVPVAASHCTPVPIHNLSGGFKGLLVCVVGFGDGEVFEEFYCRGTFKVKVRNEQGLMTTVPFSAVQVKIPPRC